MPASKDWLLTAGWAVRRPPPRLFTSVRQVQKGMGASLLLEDRLQPVQVWRVETEWILLGGYTSRAPAVILSRSQRHKVPAIFWDPQILPKMPLFSHFCDFFFPWNKNQPRKTQQTPRRKKSPGARVWESSETLDGGVAPPPPSTPLPLFLRTPILGILVAI